MIGTITSFPPIMNITNKKSNKNGASTKTNKLALVINSRTASKSRKLLAYEPDESGRSIRRKAITRLNNAELIIKSAFLPAISVRRERIILPINSKTIAKNTPILSTHKVE